jgi:hypothetical protein
MHPGDQGYQRRFAGAVLAEQHMHLAGPEVEIDAIERDHTREVLRDSLEPEQSRNP